METTSNDGKLSINWEDVLAVFSAKVTGAEDGAQVASLDDAQVDELRNIMWEMNAVSSSTRTESHEVEVTEVDEDGNETTHIWFVDADDFLLPNILGSLRDKTVETACDRLIVGGYQFTDCLTDEEIALSRQRKLPINSPWYDSVVWRSLLRREFLLKNGLNFRYPELTHGEDGLFMYEVGLCAPKSAEIKLALYCYREHSGSAETHL